VNITTLGILRDRLHKQLHGIAGFPPSNSSNPYLTIAKYFDDRKTSRRVLLAAPRLKFSSTPSG
jgi:hypothetical protein